MNNCVLFGILTTVVLVISGLVFKKSKLVSILQLSWIFILVALNTGGGDIVGNQMIYELAEPGYNGLFGVGLYRTICYFFRTSGYDYLFANLIFSVISILAVYHVVRKHTDNRNVALSLFMIFPILDFIMQKRTFCAVPFILFATELLYSDKKRKYLYSLAMTFIASQIHSSYYIFLVIITMYYIKEKVIGSKRYNKLISIIIIAVMLSLSFVPGIISHYVGEGRSELYLSGDSISFTSAIAWIVVHLFLVGILKYVSNKNNDSLGIKYEKFVNDINLGTLILVPLYFYESAFFRPFKTILILSYICIANRFTKTQDNKKLIALYISFLVIFFLTIYVWTGLGFDNLISPLYENNSFINQLVGV